MGSEDTDKFNPMTSTSDVVRRLKEIYSFKTDLECARFLGITPGGLANWKRRNTLNYSLIVNRCRVEKVNLHYLLTGEGSPFKSSQMV